MTNPDKEKKFIVSLDVVGINGTIQIDGYGYTEKEAIESAIETLLMIKSNDFDVASVEEAPNDFNQK